MTETATTLTEPVRALRTRFPFAAALVAVAALVAAIGVATSFDRPHVASPVPAAPTGVDDGYAGDLHSEYLLEISREWAPVPMTVTQRQLLNDLNSEYLISIGGTFYVPMTHDQARVRGELHSEYLRASALGW